MKKPIIILAALMSVIQVFSQTKIGKNPQSINQGAILELESSNRGLLVPRINLENVYSWFLQGTPSEGMLIYNYSESITKGFYYWDSNLSQWIRILNNYEKVSNVDDDQQITKFGIAGSDLILEIENAGVERNVSLLKLLENTEFTQTMIDSLIQNNLFVSEIKEIILNTNTKLTEEEVDNYVANNGYLTSISGNEPVFDNWDKDASDDFDGFWSSLFNIPEGFADSIDNVDDADSDPMNEIQNIENFSLSGNILNLNLTGDGEETKSVDLSSLQSNTGTDDQVISIDSTARVFTVAMEDGGSVKFKDTNTQLSEAQVEGFIDGSETAFSGWDKNASDDFDGAWGSLSAVPAGFADNTDNVDDADADASNEIQTIDAFSLAGTTLNLSLANDGEANKTVNLAALQDGTGTDDQAISIDSTGRVFTVALEDGGSVKFKDTNTQLSETEVDNFVSDNGFLTSEVDGSTTNEIQTLTGDVTSTGTTTLITTIGDDKILEKHLKAINSPTDEYVLTYESTTGDFEWQPESANDNWGSQAVVSDATLTGDGTSSTPLKVDTTLVATLTQVRSDISDSISMVSGGGGSSSTIYGEIHSVSGTVTASTSFQTVSNFTVGSSYGDITPSSGGITINAGGTAAGVYMVNYSASFSCSNNGKVISSSIFKGSSELTNIGWERKINSAGDVGSVAASGIVSLTTGDVLSIKIKQDSGPSDSNITFNKINISIFRLK